MKYLFYKFYKQALFIRKSAEPEIRAFFLFLFFQAANLYSIDQLYFYFFNPEARSSISPIEIGILIIIIFINYFLFIYKDKFLIIFNKYKDETKSKRIKGIIVAYLYVVFSVAFFIYTKSFLF